VPSLLCAMILLSIHSCATVPTTNAQSQGNQLKNSENQKGSEDEELNLPAGLTKAEAVKWLTKAVERGHVGSKPLLEKLKSK